MNENIIITSKTNKTYKDLLQLKEKKSSEGLILLEGEDLVDLAFQQGKLEMVILPESNFFSKYTLKTTIFSDSLFKSLSSYQSIPKVMGVGKFSFADKLGEKIIYLDGIQDPGNLGTIFRTALAFGFDSIGLSKDCVSPLNFKAVQASKGSLFYLKVKYVELSDLKEEGYKLYMTALGGQRLDESEKPLPPYALVVGNEGQGIREEHLLLADKKILIPMNRCIDSLNVGVACGIMMYLWGNK